MEKTPQDLGTYHAKAGPLQAELKLKEGGEYSGGLSIQTFKNYYLADVTFSREASLPPRPVSLTYHYETRNLTSLFAQLKKSEEGLETLLGDEFEREDWKANRFVLSCLFSLEQQIKNKLYEKDTETLKIPPALTASP